MLARFTALFIALAMVGCVARYVGPEEGPRAIVHFPKGPDTAHIIQNGENLSCLEMKLVHESEDRSRSAMVPAGKPVWIGRNQYPSCHISYTFIPEDGAEYVAQYTFDGSQCNADHFRVLPDGNMVKEETMKEAKWPLLCL